MVRVRRIGTGASARRCPDLSSPFPSQTAQQAPELCYGSVERIVCSLPMANWNLMLFLFALLLLVGSIRTGTKVELEPRFQTVPVEFQITWNWRSAYITNDLVTRLRPVPLICSPTFAIYRSLPPECPILWPALPTGTNYFWAQSFRRRHRSGIPPATVANAPAAFC